MSEQKFKPTFDGKSTIKAATTSKVSTDEEQTLWAASRHATSGQIATTARYAPFYHY